MSGEEDLSLRDTIDNAISRGFYLFPDIKFQCETDIKSVHGYFIVDLSKSTLFYLQIWRKNNISGNFIRIEQIKLNFSSYCENDDKQCYVDYQLPHELEAEKDDFIGFYTDNDSLARPLFSSSTSNTQLYLVPSRTNTDVINNMIRSTSIPYRPQVIGMLIIILCSYN